MPIREMLIYDPDPDTASSIKFRMEGSKWHVRTVPTPEELEAAIGLHNIQIVIMDGNLELMKKLRAKNPNLAVVLTYFMDDPVTFAAAHEAGADLIVEKNFNPAFYPQIW